MLWLVAGLWVLFILTWFVLQAWIVPRIGDWRPELEAWATRAVGVPVTLGAVQAAPAPPGLLPPLVPSFDITDLRLHDAQGRVALHLPRVQGALSVASLWRGRFEQIVVERPVLDVRRLADGRIEIAGMALTGTGTADTAMADWFFRQREFVVRGGTVRWTDERREQPPLRLSDVDFIARNGTLSHDLRLDATPEPAWGERFSLRARLREPLLDLRTLRGRDAAPWSRWSGEVHADWPRADLGRLRTRIDLPPGIELRSGEGRLRAWARWRNGRFDNLTLDTDLRGLDLQLGPDLPALAMDSVSGRIDADWDGQVVAVATRDLRFRTPEGLDWPGGSLRVEHRLARPRQGAGTTVEADGVELEALAALAGRVPLPADLRDGLQRVAPRGRLEGVRLGWQSRGSGPGAQRPLLQARGRVVDLWLAGEPSGQRSPGGTFPLPGRPGIERATVEFDLDQDGGQVRVAVRDGALLLPDVLEPARVPLSALDARGRWRLQGERIEVDLDELRVSNADLEGSAQGRWHAGDAGAPLPGVLDLTARIGRADAAAVHRYLPLSVPASARAYVREAVRAGQATDASLRLQGAVHDMPFAQAALPGTFRIAARLEGLDMDYVPAALRPPGEAAWPGVRGARGRLLLDRTALQIAGIDGAVVGAAGLRVSEGQVDIGDLAAPRVDVTARVAGPAAEALAFVQSSPLDALMAGALARARIDGSAQVGLRLQLPLAELAASRVSGTVRLDGSTLRVTPEAPPLANARATLSFTERGFAFTGARAQLLGGEAVIDGSLRDDAQGVPRLTFRGQGTATAGALRDLAPSPLARLLAQASGSVAYTAQLGFRDGLPEWQIGSSLQGLALPLPAPLTKAAADSWPLRWDSAVVPGAAAERIRLRVGPAAAPLIDLEAERERRGEQMHLRSASLALGAGAVRAPLPALGAIAQVQADELDADAWRALLGEASAAALPDGDALPLWLSLQAARVQAGGYRFQRVVLGASRTDAAWRANVDAEELGGYVEFRPGSDAQPGTVYARLARLSLSPGAPREVEQLLQQPRSVPALDIAVDDLRWGDRALGRVEVQAVNRAAGPDRAPEWRLNALRVTVPEARLSASGNWAPLGAPADGAARRRTAIGFRLDVDDSGALLARLGRPGLLRGGKGRLQGNIGWLGSPLSLDHASLSGALQTEIERGQFLKADAGAGRLLGVLSLQALPRRLVLDFRDVFSEGFAFDFLRGDARIEQGILSTNNLQMKGVNAAVLMEGTADLAREQQDLKVVVVPELNAGTASLIASAINPAVGLGSFLAQFLLRQPLQSAATQEFHITGSWADPQVAKVERNPPAAAPAGNPLQ